MNQLKLNLNVKGVVSFLSSQPQMDLSDTLKTSLLLLSVTHFPVVPNFFTTLPVRGGVCFMIFETEHKRLLAIVCFLFYFLLFPPQYFAVLLSVGVSLTHARKGKKNSKFKTSVTEHENNLQKAVN